MFTSRTLAALLLLAALAACTQTPRQPQQARLVVLGGALTETVYALGAGPLVVGLDASATFPEATATVPKVGFYRSLNPEGVLGLTPTVVLASTEAGPPEAVAQLQKAGLAFHAFANPRHLDSTRALIVHIGTLLNRPAQRDSLLAAYDTQRQQLAAFLTAHPQQPKALFIYARGAGTVQVAGSGTSGTAILEAAGLSNAAPFAGYKPLTPEAVLQADPDFLILTQNGLQSIGGMEGLKAFPGIAQCRAYREGRVLAYDDLYLLGFGPRAPQAALELARATHPDAQ